MRNTRKAFYTNKYPACIKLYFSLYSLFIYMSETCQTIFLIFLRYCLTLSRLPKKLLNVWKLLALVSYKEVAYKKKVRDIKSDQDHLMSHNLLVDLISSTSRHWQSTKYPCWVELKWTFSSQTSAINSKISAFSGYLACHTKYGPEAHFILSVTFAI